MLFVDEGNEFKDAGGASEASQARAVEPAKGRQLEDELEEEEEATVKWKWDMVEAGWVVEAMTSTSRLKAS